MLPSFVSKSGTHTYGLDLFYNGSASRVEKGLEISLVALVDLEANSAYALSVKQTPPSQPSSKRKNKNENDSRVDFYLSRLLSCLPYVPEERFKKNIALTIKRQLSLPRKNLLMKFARLA